MSAGRPSGEPLVHHELCFGCGRQNLFGLLSEFEPVDGGRVAGRCFVKQDHQGPVAGTAHPGVIATALIEALSFAGAELGGLEIELEGSVPVGGFLELEASAQEATARSAGRLVAIARVRSG